MKLLNDPFGRDDIRLKLYHQTFSIDKSVWWPLMQQCICLLEPELHRMQYTVIWQIRMIKYEIN